MTDREVATFAKYVTAELRPTLRKLGLEVGEISESGNVPGGWTIEGENPDGTSITVEVVGGPWEDDGTYEW